MRAPLLPLAALAALALAGGAPAAAPAPAPPARPTAIFPALTGRVVDQADLLSPSEEAALAAQSAALQRRTGDQLVIVTVPSLGGRSIEAYGLALGNHWHIGERGRNNGVLIVLAREERRVRIEVGRGLVTILTNDLAGAIIRNAMIPEFHLRRWYPGLAAGTRDIVETLIAHRSAPRRSPR